MQETGRINQDDPCWEAREAWDTGRTGRWAETGDGGARAPGGTGTENVQSGQVPPGKVVAIDFVLVSPITTTDFSTSLVRNLSERARASISSICLDTEPTQRPGVTDRCPRCVACNWRVHVRVP